MTTVNTHEISQWCSMNTVAERLKKARETRGWTQQHLAVAAGLSQGSIANIESGLRQSKGSLPQIAKALGVSHDWLADGEGEMFAANQAAAAPADENRQLNRLLFPARRLINLKGRMKVLNTRGQYEEMELLEHEQGAVVFHSEDPDAYAMRLKGDLLHPVLRNGWILLIEPNTKSEPTDIVLVHLRDGRRMVRELIMQSGDEYVLESIGGGDRMTVDRRELHRERGLQHVGAIISQRSFKPRNLGDVVPPATGFLPNQPPPPPQ